MALTDIISKIDNVADQILASLTGGEGLISRVERIEHSLYSGSGAGAIIPSAAIATHLQSTNFLTGSSGWKIEKSGTVEFQDGTFRGSISALSGTITGTLYVGSAANRIIIDGSTKTIKSEGYVADTSGWQISYDGTAEFNNVEARGAIYASSGNITGTLYVGSPSNRIIIDGANKLIKSENYSAGVAGWQVEYDGDAEFNNVTVRGYIYVTQNSNVTAILNVGNAGDVVKIDGANQNIESNNFVAGTSGWRIAGTGNAEFNNIVARGEVHASSGDITGTLYIGTASNRIIIYGASKTIKSEDYSAGVLGWIIDGEGTAELNEVTVRGAMYASSGAFTGTITVGTAGGTININGSTKAIYSSNYVDNTTGWKINYDGAAEFNNVEVRGAVYASSGNITGTLYVGSPSNRIIIDGTNKLVKSENYSAGTAGWQISYDGSAEFNNVIVRGELHVTSASDIGNVVDLGTAGGVVKIDGTTKAIYSSNYVDNTTGWKINYDGSAEFNSVEARGAIYASSGYFSGTVYVGAAAQRIIIDGSNKLIKSENYSAGTAGWQVKNDGTAEFNDVTVRGAVYASSGNFSGTVYVGAAADRIIIDGSNKLIKSEGYSAGLSGWQIHNDGTAEFENCTVRGVIRASTFKYDTISAVGGIQCVAPATTIAADITDVGTTLTVADAQFSNNDFIAVKEGGGFEVMEVTAGGGTTSLTVTRGVGGTAQAWKKGTAVVRWMDRIVLDTVSANSPYMDIIDYTGPLYTDAAVKVRIGNLAGITDTDLNPTGYGIYTTNGYFKGAASFGTNAEVKLDSDGITLFSDWGTTGASIDWYSDVRSENCFSLYGSTDASSVGGTITSESDASSHQFRLYWGTVTSPTYIQETYNTAATPNAFYDREVKLYLSHYTHITQTPTTYVIYTNGTGAFQVNHSYSSYGESVILAPTNSLLLDPGDTIYILAPLMFGSVNITEFSTDGTMGGNSDTALPTEKAVKTYVDTTIADLPQIYWGKNLVKNYPSLERADGAQPDWWNEQDANITLTEEDATGESIAQKHERVLKIVTGAAGASKYIYQRYTYADEPTLDVSVTAVSAGCWVYLVTAGTATLALVDGTSGSLGTATTTTTGSWVWLEVLNKTIGSGTYLDLRVSHSANSATMYVAMPMLNVGPTVRPWIPRGTRRIHNDGSAAIVSGVDPGGAAYQDLDLTSYTSALTVIVELQVHYNNTTSVNKTVKIRRNGATVDLLSNEITRNVVTTAGCYAVGRGNIQCDAGQIVEWYSNAPAGDTELVYISLCGYWEWE